MVALNSSVRYRSGGSDTNESGVGPSTPINGTGATVNGGDPGTVLDLDGTPDLSGVTAGDAIHLVGHGLFRITAVNDGADQVTIASSVSLGGGVTWGIGGDRDQAIVADVADAEAGWGYQIGDGHTVTISATVAIPAVGDTTDGPVLIEGQNGGGTMGKLSSGTNNIAHFTPDAASSFWIRDLEMENTAGSTSAQRGVNATNACNGLITGCHYDGPAVFVFTNATGVLKIYNCTAYPTQAGQCFVWNSGREFIDIDGCEFSGHNTTTGTNALVVFTNATSLCTGSIKNTIVRDGRDSGVLFDEMDVQPVQVEFDRMVVHDNGADGFELSGTPDVDLPLRITNCVVTENGGYGINGLAALDEIPTVYINFNAFRNNTSGEVNGLSNGANDVTLTADPYEAVGSDDYRPNTTSGGGDSLRGGGFPTAAGLV